MRCRLLPFLRQRPAFTLIEMLVVIALIVVITAIGILTIPLMQSQNAATRNASQTAAWLGNAKAVAVRDQRPTGLRLILDPNDPLMHYVNQVYLIQTPDDFTGGTVLTPVVDAKGNNTNVVNVYNADFTGGFAQVIDQPVQVGDYFEINGGGLLYTILGVSTAYPGGVPTSTLTLSRNCDFTLLPFIPPAPGGTPTGGTPRYRIIRQPRRLQGEDALTLTGTVEIDLSVSPNVPVRSVTDPATAVTTSYFEILFAPNGGVVGKGTVASDKIILWVRDTSKPNITDNGPVLLSVQVRTGFIGTYEVDMTSGDYYSFARDPHASGL